MAKCGPTSRKARKEFRKWATSCTLVLPPLKPVHSSLCFLNTHKASLSYAYSGEFAALAEVWTVMRKEPFDMKTVFYLYGSRLTSWKWHWRKWTAAIQVRCASGPSERNVCCDFQYQPDSESSSHNRNASLHQQLPKYSHEYDKNLGSITNSIRSLNLRLSNGILS